MDSLWGEYAGSSVDESNNLLYPSESYLLPESDSYLHSLEGGSISSPEITNDTESSNEETKITNDTVEEFLNMDLDFFGNKKSLNKNDRAKKKLIKIVPNERDESSSKDRIASQANDYKISLLKEGDPDRENILFVLFGKKKQDDTDKTPKDKIKGKKRRVKKSDDTAKINNMEDTAEINNMEDTAKINNMEDTAEINNMEDTAKINNTEDTAKINNMEDTANINNMNNSARISDRINSATIGNRIISAALGTKNETRSTGLSDYSSVGTSIETKLKNRQKRKNIIEKSLWAAIVVLMVVISFGIGTKFEDGSIQRAREQAMIQPEKIADTVKESVDLPLKSAGLAVKPVSTPDKKVTPKKSK